MTSRTVVNQPERSLAPDLARGSVLALIAVANVMIYLYGRPYGLRQHLVEPGALDRAVTFVVIMLVDCRAYPMFAALFGYGLATIAARSDATGATASETRRAVRRRCLILIGFGLVHAVAGFSGDILGWYGLLGVIVAGRLGLSDRALLRAGLGWLVLAAVVQGVIFADPAVHDRRSHLWSYAVDDPVAALGWRLVEWPMTAIGLLAVIPAVLAGIWAGRRRLLADPGGHLPLLRRAAVLGIAAGVLGGIGPALIGIQLWTPDAALAMVMSGLHIVTGVACGLGFGAAAALAAHRLSARDQLPRPIRALVAAGQCSLSCYLAQTVVFVAVLPAWTLGWGAQLGSAGAAALALATWLFTVILADRVVSRGRRGPAEILLRRLAEAGTRTPRHATIGDG